MGARAVLVVLGLTATSGAAYFSLAPVTAEVSTSVFPDWLLESLQFRLGGKVGVSVTPGSPVVEVSCGSAVSPHEIRFEDQNWVSELLGQANRTEARVKSACGELIDRHETRAVLAAIAATVLFGAAVAAGRRRSVVPKPPAQLAESGPPPGWYPAPGDPLAVWWWSGTRWATPPNIPPADADSSLNSARPALPENTTELAQAERRRDPRNAVLAGAAMFGLIVVVALIVAKVRSSEDGDASAFAVADQQAPTTVDPLLLIQQDCMRATFDTIDRAFENARAASSIDRQNSSLNLDGDSSWRDFGESIRNSGSSDCPADFRTAMIEFSNAWVDYGEDYRRASKGLSFDRMSEHDAASHVRRLNHSRALLEDIASQHGVNPPSVTYSFD